MTGPILVIRSSTHRGRQSGWAQLGVGQYDWLNSSGNACRHAPGRVRHQFLDLLVASGEPGPVWRGRSQRTGVGGSP
jgi:hypothetical protein